MPPHKHAPKPVTDTSVQSAGKVLPTRPFQPDVNNNQQAPQRHEGTEALTGGFDLTKMQYDSSSLPISPLGQPLQAKLTIGEPNDKYEQEADRVAHDVVQRIHETGGANDTHHSSDQSQTNPLMANPLHPLQRAARQEDEERLQKKSLTNMQRFAAGASTASAEVEQGINNARGSGQSLAPKLQDQMGQAMGADFSGVRVHTDARADQLNRSVGARAFTTGQNLFFKRGEYQPESRGGQELIAHELTHVVQQNATGVTRKLQESISVGKDKLAIQRRNGVSPTNFRVSGANGRDQDLSITMNTAWDSNPPNRLAELDDIVHRERVLFGANPGNYVLSYPTWAASQQGRVQLNGNTLTKLAGAMNTGNGTDTHDAAGYGLQFTVNGIPNLRKGEWNLLATQYYEYKQRNQGDDQWRKLHQSPFYIERDMRKNADGEYELTYRKWGNGIDVTVGPTRIDFEPNQAIGAVGTQRGDQTALWDTAHNQITNLCQHRFEAVGTDLRAVGNQNISIRYEITVPTPARNPGFVPYETLTNNEKNTIINTARSAVDKVIAQAVDPGAIPSRFIITVTKLNQVQQQAILTNEHGGTYRIILRHGALWNPEDRPTSMAGREAKRGFKQSTKRKNWIEASVIHEMGHMMHAVEDQNKFLVSTITPATALLIPNTDPLKAEKMSIARLNDRINQAMARKYKNKWTYAKSSPGEVVPEVFTALLKDRNVPRGLAAVYLAYGGKRSQVIDQKLQSIFGGTIPVLNSPEDAIPYINQDP